MAHECPDCCDTCRCGGDIDDMIMDGTPEELRCNHCQRIIDGEDEELLDLPPEYYPI